MPGRNGALRPVRQSIHKKEGVMPDNYPQGTNMAARLLAFAPSTAVTDALLPTAVIADGTCALGHPASFKVATRAAAKGALYARVVAEAPGLNDVPLLTRLSRASQRGTRRVIAANLHTPQESLERMLEDAVRNVDRETLRQLALSVDPREYLPRFAAATALSRAFGEIPANLIAKQLVARKDRQMVLDTVALADPAVNAAIGYALAREQLPVTLAEVLLAAPARHPDLLSGALDAVRMDHDRATDYFDPAVTAAFVELVTSGGAHASHRRMLEMGGRMSASTVAAFLATKNPSLVAAVARSAAKGWASVDDTELETIVKHAQQDTASNLFIGDKALLDRLTPTQIETLAATMPLVRSVKEMLSSRAATLPPRTIFALLRAGSSDLLVHYLTGDFRISPEVTVVEWLLADPGRAFTHAPGVYSGYGINLPQSNLPTGISDLIGHFASAFELRHLADPGIRALLDAAGPRTLVEAAAGGSHNAFDNVFLVYLAGEIRERFGDDPEAWLLAASMGAGTTVTTGTVTDFLDVLEAVLGRPSRRQTAAAAVDTDTPSEVADEDGALFAMPAVQASRI
jgi:hypothetical protein